MKKGKTEYKFRINADFTQVEAVIRNYLYSNSFVQKPKEGANYYSASDPMQGNKCFEYYIQDGQVTILAYFGSFEKPKSLEGFVGVLPKQNYRNSLQVLFEELKKLEDTDLNFTAAEPNGSLSTFMEQNEKKKETGVIVGFVMSVIGVLLSCIGFTYGILLYIIEIYLAVQGIHTKKKGLAIATIVLAGVSILILLGVIVLTVLVSAAA